ncbi:hypothetical protein K445DRAFT_279225 [Daldinia sp. EC12]|nr:hypothetical protein K445DRAFT_279225 [Daldinia sp. EC12]
MARRVKVCNRNETHRGRLTELYHEIFSMWPITTNSHRPIYDLTSRIIISASDFCNCYDIRRQGSKVYRIHRPLSLKSWVCGVGALNERCCYFNIEIRYRGDGLGVLAGHLIGSPPVRSCSIKLSRDLKWVVNGWFASSKLLTWLVTQFFLHIANRIGNLNAAAVSCRCFLSPSCVSHPILLAPIPMTLEG